MSGRSSVSPHHSLYLELPHEIRRIWKCPWLRVRCAVSELSGALRALLIKSQSVEEIPGITRWETALTHPPKPQCGQKEIGGCDLLHHCQGRWDSSANPSLPLNPQPWNHWRCLGMQYMEPSTQGGSQTLPPKAEANSCIAASHPFISEEGCERSSFLLCCDHLPRTAPGVLQSVTSQPSSVPGTLQVRLMP